MKDWPELILSLIQDLGDYADCLEDMGEDAPDEISRLIAVEHKQICTVIENLKAHKVAEAHPDLEKLMLWDPGFRTPN